MTASQRVILNALATYGRTVFGMALGLFSSRWILQALGVVDYGLMAVVGSLIVFVTFLNGVSAASCARFFALSIGKHDPDETNRWFNTALSIHTILPAILILIGWPIGEWAIGCFLNIPEARLTTARWVFRFSLVSAFWGMVSTPYMAMFTAKQNIVELSIWAMAGSVVNFGFVYWLTSYSGDAWLVYAGFTVLISVALGLAQVWRARCLFPECGIRLSRWFDKVRLLQVFSFSWWSMFGQIGWLLRSQGIAILLNKYFEPKRFPYVNASFGLGGTVSGYTQTLSAALMGAFTPEITAREGSGDRSGMIRQALQASKFGTSLVLVFAVPLMLEIKYVLVLWLKNPPLLANEFCVLMILTFLVDRLSTGEMVAINARGKIAAYQMTIGGLIILTLPLAWLFLAFGWGALSVGWAILIITVLCTLGRVVWSKYLLGSSVRQWVRCVLLPCSATGCIIAIACFGVMEFLQPCFFRLVLVCFVALLVWMALTWFLVLDIRERSFFKANFNQALVKFGFK